MQLRLIALFFAATFFSTSSQAGYVLFPSIPTFSTSLPSLNGSYAYPDNAPPLSFDLGMQFSSIATASIEWTATGTAGSYQWCTTGYGYCGETSIGPMAYYRFEDEPGFTGDSGSLSLEYTSSTLWRPDLLRDGKGTLYFGHAAIPAGYDVLSYPTFEVSDVRLVIQGIPESSDIQSTVVPLPAALPLLLSGITGLFFFQRKRKLA